MSTLRVTGLKQETSSATNISMAVGGGVTVAGIATFHNNAIFTNDVTVSGNISVGGTLTYQDVTDVDSIGIITARNGIHVTSGSVGIGTANPSDKLEVKGDTGAAVVVLSSGDTGLTGNDVIGQINFKDYDTNAHAGGDQDDLVNIKAIVKHETGNASGIDGSDGEGYDLTFSTSKRSGSNSAFTVSEKLRITDDGNIGIGTDNPNQPLHIHANGTSYVRFTDETSGIGATDGVIFGLDHPHLYAWNYEAGDFVVATNATEKFRITSDGKLILSGTARTTPFISGDGGMCIEQSHDGNLRALTIRNKDTDAAAATSLAFSLNRTGGDVDFVGGEIKLEKEQSWSGTSTTIDGAMVFSTVQNETVSEKLRINAAGNISINGSYVHGSLAAGGGGGGYISKDEIAQYANSSASNFFRGWDASGSSNALRVQLKGNGGIANYQANDSNLCDEREKKNIVSLDSKWDKVKSWELKKFHYNEDADTDDLKYGVIAQQVEEHCPEVITDWEKDEGVIRKGVKEQQMTWMAIKALQEAMTRIETLEAEVAVLKES